MAMTKRGFLKALAAVPLAALMPAAKPKLAFHKDAFAFVTAAWDSGLMSLTEAQRRYNHMVSLSMETVEFYSTRRRG